MTLDHVTQSGCQLLTTIDGQQGPQIGWCLLCARGGALRPHSFRQHRGMVRLLDSGPTAQQPIVLAGAGRERLILEHPHLPQDVFQEVYSDAVPEQTFYRWKKKYAGLGVAELRRLKQLEEENRKLKALVADLSLDKKMLQDVVLGKL